MSHVLDNTDVASLRRCMTCPRRCGADRLDGPLGYCNSGAGANIGSICLHGGEEPALCAGGGICNVFFNRCNLQCAYCQNYQISRNDGRTPEVAADLDSATRAISVLLDQGARRVGFVSPSHCIPQMRALMEALAARRPRPVFVFNANGYDLVETVRALEPDMDIYLPDLKYMDGGLAAEFSGARDYPAVAGAALREMFRQKGSRLELDEDGGALSGLIVRHLVLPGCVENSLRCLRFIAEELSPSVHLSLLAQYHPTPAVAGHPQLGRTLRQEEYAAVVEEMERLGFHNGWTQQLSSPAAYNPDFRRSDPFAPEDN